MSTLRDEQSTLSTVSLVVLAAVAIAFVLYLTRSAMIPFVLAVFLASVVAPMVDYLVLQRRVPHAVAVSATLLVVLAIVVALAAVLGFAGQQLVLTAGDYAANLEQTLPEIERLIQPVQTFLERRQWKIADDLGSVFRRIIDDVKTFLPGFVRATFGTTLYLAQSMFLVTIFVIFMLAGRNPHSVRSGIRAEIDRKVRGYVAAKFALSAVTGLLVGIVLALLGLPMASVFGILAFLLNFIPSIGSVIATLLPIPIAIVHFGDLPHVLAAVLIPGILQMAIGNGLEPKLLGDEMKLHPVTVVLALSVWGLLWGLVGMLLAVPITAVLRLVLERFETSRPIALLMAGDPSG